MRSYSYKLLSFLCLISVQVLSANPFKVEFPDIEHPTFADYERLQSKLRQIQTDKILDHYYDGEVPLLGKELYRLRIAEGARQVMIDPSKNQYPVVMLEKIGKGGDSCIVSYASYNRIYPELLDSIKDALEEVGFNGYFYYRVGGFPNPTGRELKYAGVPYCFKPFMMVEAYHLGFQKVLWIDASLLPSQNPEPLFEAIEKEGCLLYGGLRESELFSKFILPKAEEALQEITGSQGKERYYVSAMVFGLNFGTELAEKFLETYYQCVSLGTPFISCFPEEFVFSSILNGQSLNGIDFPRRSRLVRNAGEGPVFEAHQGQRKLEEVFFLYRKH